MSYFDRETKRVELPSDKELWVDLYSTLTWAEVKRFRNLNGELVLPMDEALPLLIADWNIKDKDGNIAPVNAENIDKLHKDDAIVLVAAVQGVITESTDDADDTKKKTGPSASPANSEAK